MVAAQELKVSILERESMILRELLRAIRIVAEDARRQQWVHADTAESLDSIIEYAEVGAKGVTDEDEEVDDFPP